MSYVLSPLENSEKPKRKPRTPSAPQASLGGGQQLVTDAWFKAYENRYGKKPVWTGRHAKQLKILLQACQPEELVSLIAKFFSSRNSEITKTGHSFVSGYASFCGKLDELRAMPSEKPFVPYGRAEALAQHEREMALLAADEARLAGAQ